MILRAGFLVRLEFAYGAKHIGGCARGQHVAAMQGHADKNLGHLRRALAGGEDHLRHAGAQRAMMIELGKADVFKGQVAQAVERIVDLGAALAHFIEQRFNLRAIHQSSFAVSPAA